MNRVVIYCRQSDTRGAGEESLSLESQEAAMRDRSRREGWHVVEVVREADVKGWMDEAKRPGFREVLHRARDRRDFDILLVWDASRFARKVKLQEIWIDEFAACGVRVVSHTQAWFEQTMFRQIIGSINEDRTRESGAHLSRVFAHRVQAQGKHHGPAPFGFRHSPDRTLELDPEEAAVVREIYERYADGGSLRDIAIALTERGVPTQRDRPFWGLPTLHRIITNPVYCGSVTRKGEAFPSSIPRIIPEELEQRVKRQRSARSVRRAPRPKHAGSWLEGSVLHSCGATGLLVVSARVAPVFRCSGRVYTACDHYPKSRGKWQLETEARQAIAEAFDALPAKGVVIDRARVRLGDSHEQRKTARQRMEEDRAGLDRKLERIARVMIDADLDESWYDAERRKVLDERDRLDREIAALPDDTDLDTLSRLHDEIAALSNGDLLRRLDDPGQWRRIVQRVCWVEYGPQGVRLLWREPFGAIFGPA